MSSLQYNIAQAIGNAGVLAATVGSVLIWTELGWFACGELSESERVFMYQITQRSLRAAFVTSELEALQQATLWQIAQGRLTELAAADLVGQTKPRAKYLKLVK
jgi:hypothetical protein